MAKTNGGSFRKLKTQPAGDAKDTTPAPGQMAPPFSLPSSTSDSVALKDFAGKRTVVIFFYPKADTPGCTTETCGFRDAHADYERAGVAVLGVSPDPIERVRK